jgi:hypothetical protein
MNFSYQVTSSQTAAIPTTAYGIFNGTTLICIAFDQQEAQSLVANLGGTFTITTGTLTNG